MEWLNNAISSPGAGLVAVPVMLAIYWALNASEKEKARKGLHPFTKACLWTFGIFLAFVGAIMVAKFIGLL